jgi:N-acetylmuramic acid 6-phosphate etherase
MHPSTTSITDRGTLATEQRLPESMALDSLSIDDALALMNQQDLAAVHAVISQRESIGRAVALVADAFRRGGRLIYAGAGTSGRLGILDAAECPPTFGTSPEMVQAIIAGGPGAVFKSVEGAEDHAASGTAAIDEKSIGANDVVIGIAAGGTTPFVRGALARARQRGAKTVFLCCVKPMDGEPDVDLVIRPVTGPEVLTGSTRLKAGTATKLALNQITTLAMVQLGKVYENLMVDLKATNQKLQDRAARIVAALTNLPRSAAIDLLASADGQVKTAIVMQRLNVSAAEARAHLEAADGNLRRALEQK